MASYPNGTKPLPQPKTAYIFHSQRCDELQIKYISFKALSVINDHFLQILRIALCEKSWISITALWIWIIRLLISTNVVNCISLNWITIVHNLIRDTHNFILDIHIYAKLQISMANHNWDCANLYMNIHRWITDIYNWSQQDIWKLFDALSVFMSLTPYDDIALGQHWFR